MVLQEGDPGSGGSRIPRGGGGIDPWGGIDLQCGRFLVKMYAKMKELGPMGGVKMIYKEMDRHRRWDIDSANTVSLIP